MTYSAVVGTRRYRFADLKEVLAKAGPARSGDALAGLIAECAAERMAARLVLADLPLRRFLDEAMIGSSWECFCQVPLDSARTRTRLNTKN